LPTSERLEVCARDEVEYQVEHHPPEAHPRRGGREAAQAGRALRAAPDICWETLGFLQAAYDERSPRLVYLKVEPAFDFLHDDERYRDLVRKIGLP
jgi:hypothetical protein